MTTGQRIKAARKRAGLTQKELGAKLGVAYQTLAQWENDLRNPKIETIQRIADALGVSLQYILGVVDEDNFLLQTHFADPGDFEFIKSLGIDDPVKRKAITFNATIDPEWAELESKLIFGTITDDELQRYKELLTQGTENAHKSVGAAMKVLQRYMDNLNDEGQMKVYYHASDYAKELAENPKYKRLNDAIVCSDDSDTTAPENQPEATQEDAEDT